MGGPPRYVIRRIKGKLRHNIDGGIAVNQFWEMEQSVDPPRNSVAIMQIDVAANKPNAAIFNGSICRDLYSAAVDKQMEPPQSCGGAFGLVSLGHAATFRSARFIIHPNK